MYQPCQPNSLAWLHLKVNVSRIGGLKNMDTNLVFQTGQHAPIHWGTHHHNYYHAIVY